MLSGNAFRWALCLSILPALSWGGPPWTDDSSESRAFWDEQERAVLAARGPLDGHEGILRALQRFEEGLRRREPTPNSRERAETLARGQLWTGDSERFRRLLLEDGDLRERFDQLVKEFLKQDNPLVRRRNPAAEAARRHEAFRAWRDGQVRSLAAQEEAEGARVFSEAVAIGIRFQVAHSGDNGQAPVLDAASTRARLRLERGEAASPTDVSFRSVDELRIRDRGDPRAITWTSLLAPSGRRVPHGASGRFLLDPHDRFKRALSLALAAALDEAGEDEGTAAAVSRGVAAVLYCLEHVERLHRLQATVREAGTPEALRERLRNDPRPRARSSARNPYFVDLSGLVLPRTLEFRVVGGDAEPRTLGQLLRFYRRQGGSLPRAAPREEALRIADQVRDARRSLTNAREEEAREAERFAESMRRLSWGLRGGLGGSALESPARRPTESPSPSPTASPTPSASESPAGEPRPAPDELDNLPERSFREAQPLFLLEPPLPAAAQEVIPIPEVPAEDTLVPIEVPASAAGARTLSTVDLVKPPAGGWVVLPLGDRELLALAVHGPAGPRLRPGVHYDLFRGPQGGVFLRSRAEQGSFGFVATAGAAAPRRPIAPPVLGGRGLRAVVEALREAGITALAAALEAAADREAPFTTESLARAIDETSAYSWTANGGDASGVPETSRYRRHSRAVDGAGRLRMQCHRAVALFVDIVEHYREVTGEALRARLVPCYVARTLNGQTVVSDMGHAIAEVTTDEGSITHDPQPRRDERGAPVRAPDASHPRPAVSSSTARAEEARRRLVESQRQLRTAAGERLREAVRRFGAPLERRPAAYRGAGQRAEPWILAMGLASAGALAAEGKLEAADRIARHWCSGAPPIADLGAWAAFLSETARRAVERSPATPAGEAGEAPLAGIPSDLAALAATARELTRLGEPGETRAETCPDRLSEEGL